jgi:hypothetical protein
MEDPLEGRQPLLAVEQMFMDATLTLGSGGQVAGNKLFLVSHF